MFYTYFEYIVIFLVICFSKDEPDLFGSLQLLQLELSFQSKDCLMENDLFLSRPSSYHCHACNRISYSKNEGVYIWFSMYTIFSSVTRYDVFFISNYQDIAHNINFMGFVIGLKQICLCSDHCISQKVIYRLDKQKTDTIFLRFSSEK